MRVEHRSTNPNHLSPDVILEAVRDIGPIGLDPCTTGDNPTGARYIRTEDCDPNGLETAWHEFGGIVYVNPPYGRHRGKRCLEWVEKAIEESDKGAKVIMLLPARTDTSWFQRLFAYQLCFIRGRLTFKGQINGAPFPSALVNMGVTPRRFIAACEGLGAIV